MKSLLNWLTKRFTTVRPAARPERRARLSLDQLEDRMVPTVVNYGGPILPHVEIQPVFYGSNWSSTPSQVTQFQNYLNYLATSPYMDMLANAGYGVGQGSTTTGKIINTNLAAGSVLTDSTIQAAIQNGMKTSNMLAGPDANRLYVVFVQPNVEVVQSNGNTSLGYGFASYHYAFQGTDASGHAATIHYAVVCTPGGTINNAYLQGDRFLSQFNEMTASASHEIAESVTDPDVTSYATVAWYDESPTGGEIGDMCNGQVVYLNGYAVQRIVDQNDQPMTPAGATAFRPVSFILESNGQLLEYAFGGVTNVSTSAGPIASVSDQGIDDAGFAMVDVVTTSGIALEYHDGWGWSVLLSSGVKSAVAGQGVSYVLSTSGSLSEYIESANPTINPLAMGTWKNIDWGVASISAGTDKKGVNTVDYIYNWMGLAAEDSDSSGWHSFATNVASISAGQHGISDYVTRDGKAYWYNETIGTPYQFASGVAQVTTGVGANGKYIIDLLYTNGDLYQYTDGASSWTYVAGSIKSVDKGRAGVVDMIQQEWNGPRAWEYNGYWTPLTQYYWGANDVAVA
jgi:hypothetical protein